MQQDVEAAGDAPRAGREDAVDGKPQTFLADDVYAVLRSEVLGLTLPPGASLDEPTLVTRFGISRTPIREALRRLASDGLVDIVRGLGARVRPILIEDVRDYFECLQFAQKAVLLLAAARITPPLIKDCWEVQARLEDASRLRSAEQLTASNIEFHITLAKAADNGLMVGFYRRLLEEGTRLSTLISRRYLESDWNREVEVVCSEHRALINAVSAKQMDLVSRLSDQHVQLFRSKVISALTRGDTDDVLREASDLAVTGLGR